MNKEDRLYKYLNDNEELFEEYVLSVHEDSDSAESKNYRLNNIECYYDWALDIFIYQDRLIKRYIEWTYKKQCY